MSVFYVGCKCHGQAVEAPVRGLSNNTLSCAINALLQSLSATTELLEILNRWNPSAEVEVNTVPVQLKNALCAMKDKSNRFPHRDFLRCLHHHAIHFYTLQDADEIFHIILSLTQKQMPEKDLAQEIRTLYEIRMETQVMCNACGSICKVPNSFFSLPLAIHEGRNNLESCIQSLYQQETLLECFCDTCAEKKPSTHRQKFVSLPAVLCVHLKRFRNDHGFIRKLENRVNFPDTLQMHLFDAEPSTNADEYYSLFAVIVHVRMAIVNHYTAYVRPSQYEEWFYTDDSFVRRANWEEVCYTYEGKRTAYMLLYRKMKWTLSG